MTSTLENLNYCPEFQAELARVWKTYLAIQQTLAADDFPSSRQALAGLKSAAAAIDDSSLTARARLLWSQERVNLAKLIDSLQKTEDIESMRVEFAALTGVEYGAETP